MRTLSESIRISMTIEKYKTRNDRRKTWRHCLDGIGKRTAEENKTVFIKMADRDRQSDSSKPDSFNHLYLQKISSLMISM